MNSDLIRMVDSICRDRNIDRELLYQDLELALVAAVRKHYGQDDVVEVSIDRRTGEISARHDGAQIGMEDLGRISAQTAKQVIIQRIREAERGSIFEEFSTRKDTIVTGQVSRFEGGSLVVGIGRAEGFLPRSEQIPGEMQAPGERIRCLILDVRTASNQVKIVLSRTHPDFIKRLFEVEVPEVAERVIEIRALAREAGYRTKVAVSSIDTKVDAVGACVGVRGSRIKNIVEELGGEKIDIVRWNESSQILIGNALKPAEISETALCFELGRATVVVNEDQLSLAIGKRGQNVRLAARLTDWDIDILTPAEYNKGLDDMEKTLTEIDGVDADVVAKFAAMGLISLMDIDEVGADPLIQTLELPPELAQQIVEVASVEAKNIAEQNEAKQREAAEQAAREAVEAKEAAEKAVDDADPSAEEQGEASAEGESLDSDQIIEQDADELEEKSVDESPKEEEPAVVDTESSASEPEPVSPDGGAAEEESDSVAPPVELASQESEDGLAAPKTD
jgi:N utilization substance protein A